jgi:hypothetical protein
MSNHYHLVLETPNANLVAGMAWLQSTYTIRLNHRHKLIGHVLSGRYKAQLVEGSGNGYLRTACDYVHLNPIRAHLLKPEERLLSYPWSSFGYYLSAPEHRRDGSEWTGCSGEHDIEQDSPGGRRRFEEQMEARRLQPGDEETLKALRRGWCVGGATFRQEQLGRMEGKLGHHHAGELRPETAEAKGERIVAEELQRLGWKGDELVLRRKNDPGKMAMAVRLRRETTFSMKDIAARLHLGTSNTANARLHSAMKEFRRTESSQSSVGI